MNQPPRSRLLLVDDDDAALTRLREALRDEYEVHTATRIDEALRILGDVVVDVVVASDRVADTPGVDFLHWVRLRAEHCIRVLLVDAASPPWDQAAVRRASLFRILARPCPDETLRQTLRQATRAARLGGLRQQPRGAPATASSAEVPTQAAPSGGGTGTGAAAAEESTNLRRVWSKHGITVEEEIGSDPSDTARIFAELWDKRRRAEQPPLPVSSLSSDSSSSGPRAEVRTVLPPGESEPAPVGTAPPAPSDTAGTAAAAGTPPPARSIRRVSDEILPWHDPVHRELLLLSDDAILGERLRLMVRDHHSVQVAATVAQALERLCQRGCATLLIDARRLSEAAVVRLTSVLAPSSPGMCVLVLAPRSENRFHTVLDPDLGIISLVYLPLEAEQLLGTIGWCARLHEEDSLVQGGHDPFDVDPAAISGRLRQLLASTAR
jgi:DNA-binding response OmpR family regulator